MDCVKLDSARTQVAMENLLRAIAHTGATIAIVDITGVPTVDTLVAQHMMKTISALNGFVHDPSCYW